MTDTSTASLQQLLSRLRDGPQSFSALVELVEALAAQNQEQQDMIDELRRKLETP